MCEGQCVCIGFECFGSAIVVAFTQLCQITCQVQFLITENKFQVYFLRVWENIYLGIMICVNSKLLIYMLLKKNCYVFYRS